MIMPGLIYLKQHGLDDLRQIKVIKEIRYQSILFLLSKIFSSECSYTELRGSSVQCLFIFRPAEARAWSLLTLIAVISLAFGEQLRCCLDINVHGDTFCCVVWYHPKLTGAP